MMSQVHYFTQESLDPSEYFLLKDTIGQTSLEVFSAPGLFSAKRFDTGTKVMLKHIHYSGTTHCRLLDIGCGYGLVSVFFASKFLQKKNPTRKSLHIDACDISPLAVDLTRYNLREYYHPYFSYQVKKSDGLTDPYFDEKFYDMILINPPFSLGKSQVKKLIHTAYDHLSLGAKLWIVVPTKRGAKSYLKWSQEEFGEECVTIQALESGYRVRTITKPS